MSLLPASENRRTTDTTELPAGPRVDTAALILREAATLFRRKGYSKATTAELGEAVGIRGPSVYFHFKTKEDILYGICTESLRRLTDAVTRAAEHTPDGLTRLEAMIDAHLANLLTDRDMHTTAFLEMRWLSNPLRAEVSQRRHAYEEMFHAAILDAQERGELRNDLGARELDLGLLGLLNWAVFWYRPEGPMSIEDVTAALTTLFLDGALPRTQGQRGRQ